MTATSALSASNANHFPTERPVEIRLPGSDRTYEVRDVLRGMGLRWDPATHAWHGHLIAPQRAFLERQFGLATRAVVPIEAFATAEPPSGPRANAPTRALARPRPPAGPRGPTHDYSRTHFESRIAFPVADVDAVEIATPTRRFSLDEITSGLPDDSREADERAEARWLRELRARVKAARALVATTPGLAWTLASDPQKMAQFAERFGVTQSQFRLGVLSDDATERVLLHGH